MRLPELQREFTRSVLYDPSPLLMRAIRQDSITRDARLAVYRNNIYVGLFNALKEAFPTTCKLVSEDYFRTLVRGYVQAHPPQSGNLDTYGADLPAFLRNESAAQPYPFLSDIAQLEWLMHEVRLAEDDEPLPPLSLSSLSADDLDKTIINLRHSVRLMQSQYPLSAIWQFANGALKKPPELVQQNRYYIVYRHDLLDAWFEGLDEGQFIALKSIATGHTLLESLNRAATIPSFNAANFFTFTLQRELFKK